MEAMAQATGRKDLLSAIITLLTSTRGLAENLLCSDPAYRGFEFF
jgi:hypothetical protein